jgi:hypothetical protein
MRHCVGNREHGFGSRFTYRYDSIAADVLTFSQQERQLLDPLGEAKPPPGEVEV